MGFSYTGIHQLRCQSDVVLESELTIVIDKCDLVVAHQPVTRIGSDICQALQCVLARAAGILAYILFSVSCDISV